MPREFKSPYDFYRLDEAERKLLVDDVFTVPDRANVLYFPVQLNEYGMNCNYGVRQGVLAVSPIWPLRYKAKGVTANTWFKVWAFSPDDLDLSLEWADPTPELREQVLALVREMPKDEVDYHDCLRFIQSYYGGETDGM